MQEKHKFNIEVEEETWTEIGVIACRKKSTRAKVAANILEEYILKILNKEKK